MAKTEQERYDAMLNLIKEEFPNEDYDDAVIRYDFLEMKVYPPAAPSLGAPTRYFKSKYYPGYAVECQTEFGIFLDLERSRPGRGRIVYTDCPYEAILITEFIDSEVGVMHFSKVTGARHKGRRNYLKVSTSAKGHYITVNKKRVYLPAEWFSDEG